MGKRYAESFFSITAWLLQHLSYPLCRWYFFRLKGWTVDANPQLGRVQKPVILAAAPHRSHADVVLVPASIPIRLLPVRWLADKRIFGGRLTALPLRLWGAIPVDRDRVGAFEPGDIQWILDFAKRRNCIGVFPECCLVGGRFGAPHRDLVITALGQNICVLPLGLEGNAGPERSPLQKGAKQKTQVSIGEPLSNASDLLDAWAS